MPYCRKCGTEVKDDEISVPNVMLLLLGVLEEEKNTQNGGREKSLLKNNDVFQIMRRNLNLLNQKSYEDF